MARVWRLSEELEAAGLARARAAPRVGAAETPPTDTAGERKSWLAEHPREAAIGAGLLVVAGAVRMAGASPVLALLALPVGAVAVAVWRRRGRAQHRSRVEVVGGSSWPLHWSNSTGLTWRWAAWRWDRHARRELGHVVALWPWIAERSGIPHAVLARAVADPKEGYSLHIRLARGQVGTDIRLPRLATALREFRVGPPMTPDPRRPWEIVLAELPDEDVGDDVGDVVEAPAWSSPEPLDLAAERLAALQDVVDQLGPELVSAAELGWRAGRIPRDWMAQHIEELAPQLGLRRVGKKWQRLAVAAEGDR